MSVGSRIKEARIRAGITQEQLAAQLNVSKGAVGNYENDTNYPKTEIIFELCRLLNCDANYLYQDDIKAASAFRIAFPEQQLLKEYRTLDDHGKTVVDSVLKLEYERCKAAENITVPLTIAAHADGMEDADVQNEVGAILRDVGKKYGR